MPQIKNQKQIKQTNMKTGEEFLFERRAFCIEFIKDKELQETTSEKQMNKGIQRVLSGNRKSYIKFKWEYFEPSITREEQEEKGFTYIGKEEYTIEKKPRGKRVRKQFNSDEEKEIIKEYHKQKSMGPVLKKFDINRYEYLKEILVRNNVRQYTQSEILEFKKQKKSDKKVTLNSNGYKIQFDNLLQQAEYIMDKRPVEMELIDLYNKMKKSLYSSIKIEMFGYKIYYTEANKYSGDSKRWLPILAIDMITKEKIIFLHKQDAVEYIIENSLQNTDHEVSIKSGIKDQIIGKKNSYLGFKWEYYDEPMNDIPSTIKVISYEDKQPDTKKVYKIINTITDEIYVGVTEKSLKSRLYYHKRDYNKPQKKGRKLYESIAKYGKENFIIELIEEVPYDEGFKRESYWINKLNTNEFGLNSDSGQYGVKTNLFKNYYDSNTYSEQDIIDEYKKIKCFSPVMEKFNISQVQQLKRILNYHDVYIYPNEEATQNYHNFKNKLNHSKIKMIDEDGNETIFDNIEECYNYLKDNGITNGKFKSVRQKIRNVINGKKDQFFGLRFGYQN